MLKPIAQQQVSTPLQRREPTADGQGGRLVCRGWTIADATLSIDIEGLFEQLRHRAIRSKGGKSKFMQGLVVMSVENIRDTA